MTSLKAVKMQSGKAFIFIAVNPEKAEELLKRQLKTQPTQDELVAIQLPVKLGKLQNGNYPIIKGLKKTDRVVVGNTSLLHSGMIISGS